MVRLDKFLVASILMLATRSSVISAPVGMGDFLKACFGASCPVKNEPTDRNPSPQQSPISYTTSPNALPLKANQNSKSGASDVVKSCSGASCPQNVKPADRNTPPQQSPSSGSHITSQNALPLKSKPESKAGENIPHLDQNMLEENYQRTPVADQKNFRLSNKGSSTLKPRVWELYCAKTQRAPNSSKAGHLVNMYSFCMKNYTVTFTYYPKIQACLDDVDKDVSLLGASMFEYDQLKQEPNIIREILNRGSAPDVLTSLLWSSAVRGDAEMTKTLLEHKVNPNEFAPGQSPLLGAVMMDNTKYDGSRRDSVGRLECVKFLLQNGADPTVKNADSKTPLEIATENNNGPMIEVLTRTTRSSTLKPRVWELYCAKTQRAPNSSKAGHLVNMYSFCMKNYTVTFTYYPKIQACLDDVDKDVSLLGASMFEYDQLKQEPNIIREILNRGSAPDVLTSLLWSSAVRGDAEMTKTLLEHKVNPNEFAPGQSPLLGAVMMDNTKYDGSRRDSVGRLECVKFLLQNGADPTVKNADSKTPLEIATENNNGPMIEVLTRTTRSSTLKPRVWELYCAKTQRAPNSSKAGHLVNMYSFCMKNYTVTFTYYPKIQACLDDVDKDVSLLGASMFEYDQLKQEPNIIREILNRGSAPDVLTSLLWSSAVRGDAEMTKTLLEHKVNPNEFAPGQSPLLGAVMMDNTKYDGSRRDSVGRLECVKLLLQNGADPTVKNADSKTPLEIATENNNNAMIKVLTRTTRSL